MEAASHVDGWDPVEANERLAAKRVREFRKKFHLERRVDEDLAFAFGSFQELTAGAWAEVRHAALVNLSVMRLR